MPWHRQARGGRDLAGRSHGPRCVSILPAEAVAQALSYPPARPVSWVSVMSNKLFVQRRMIRSLPARGSGFGTGSGRSARPRSPMAASRLPDMHTVGKRSGSPRTRRSERSGRKRQLRRGRRLSSSRAAWPFRKPTRLGAEGEKRRADTRSWPLSARASTFANRQKLFFPLAPGALPAISRLCRWN